MLKNNEFFLVSFDFEWGEMHKIMKSDYLLELWRIFQANYYISEHGWCGNALINYSNNDCIVCFDVSMTRCFDVSIFRIREDCHDWTWISENKYSSFARISSATTTNLTRKTAQAAKTMPEECICLLENLWRLVCPASKVRVAWFLWRDSLDVWHYNRLVS